MAKMLTIARYVLIEGIRNRLGILAGMLLAAALGVAVFLKSISLTETAQIQAAFLGAGFRLAAVFVLASFVITSQVRETADKGLELILSTSLPRSHYIGGKLLGYLAVGLFLAVLFSVPLLMYSNWRAVVLWATSLWFELSIVAAVSLFCVLTFSHVVVALSVVFGFYFLARSLAVIQLMSGAQAGADPSWATQVADRVIRALAFLLPRLDQFTKTEWLVYWESQPPALEMVAIQALTYLVLLLGAMLFDFQRRSV
jgi:ABC-type Na+ efflux pump permease subunit